MRECLCVVGVGGMGWKNWTIFKFSQVVFFKKSFWSLKKVKKIFLKIFSFGGLPAKKTSKIKKRQKNTDFS